MAKTLAVKRQEALDRLQSHQAKREQHRDELVAERKKWEGQRAIPADRKQQRDDHIASCNADIGKRAREIQRLQIVIANDRRY